MSKAWSQRVPGKRVKDPLVVSGTTSALSQRHEHVEQRAIESQVPVAPGPQQALQFAPNILDFARLDILAPLSEDTHKYLGGLSKRRVVNRRALGRGRRGRRRRERCLRLAFELLRAQLEREPKPARGAAHFLARQVERTDRGQCALQAHRDLPCLLCFLVLVPVLRCEQRADRW